MCLCGTVMEALKKTPVLDFHPDTLQFIRKQYRLESPERMNEAIQILEEWIDKQNHFEQKKFPKEYLERVIVNNKGLLEKSKKKLDRLCTLRTLSPDFFEIFDLKECDFESHQNILLPKLTPDYNRVHIIKINGKSFTSKLINNYHRYMVLKRYQACASFDFNILFQINDYQQAYDYCNGMTFIVDFTNCSITDFTLNLNIMDTRKFLEIFFEGYGMRIKAIHYLTPSKTIEAMLMVMKQLLSAKLYERYFVHKSPETLYEYIPREILPKEYGGDEKSLTDLQDMLKKELTSNEFLEYKREMLKCRTNEKYRQADKFNDEYMGMSGTFRNLRVD